MAFHIEIDKMWRNTASLLMKITTYTGRVSPLFPGWITEFSIFYCIDFKIQQTECRLKYKINVKVMSMEAKVN